MNNQNQSLSPFSITKLIGAALISGVIFFAMVSFMTQGTYHLEYDPDDMMLPVVFMVLLTGTVASIFLVNKFVVLTEPSNLTAKLGNYQTRTIIKFAMIEAPAIFAIFQFMTTGSLYYIFMALVALVVMVYLFPSKQKFILEYNLTMDERSEVNKMK